MILNRFVLLLALAAWVPGPLARAQEDQRRPDAPIDADAPPPTFFEPLPGLELGARLSLDIDYEDNSNLDDSDNDEEFRIRPRFTFRAEYDLEDAFGVENIKLYFEGRTSLDLEFRPEYQDEVDFDLRSLYVRFRDLPFKDVDIRVGRQRFDDDRGWLYDARLDGVRVDIDTFDRLDIELSISTDLIDPEDNEDRIVNWIMHNRINLPRRQELALWGIVRSDQSVNNDETRVYLGASHRGRIWRDNRWNARNSIYTDLATLWGDDDGDRRAAWALDTGWITEFRDAPLRPTVYLGFAYGSGDRGGNTDNEFRQTGLHDNESAYNGLASFKYYGEALDPELSNLLITTVGVGIRQKFDRFDASLDLVHHYYWQPQADDRIRSDTNNPQGDDRDIGHGIDLILGIRWDNGLRARLNSGLFIPGAAFAEEDEQDVRIVVRTELQYTF